MSDCLQYRQREVSQTTVYSRQSRAADVTSWYVDAGSGADWPGWRGLHASFLSDIHCDCLGLSLVCRLLPVANLGFRRSERTAKVTHPLCPRSSSFAHSFCSQTRHILVLPDPCPSPIISPIEVGNLDSFHFLYSTLASGFSEFGMTSRSFQFQFNFSLFQ